MTESATALEAAKWVAWHKGHLRHITKPHGQRDVYDAIHSWKDADPLNPGPLVMNAHRGFGKTFIFCLLAFERCLRYPNQIARIGSKDRQQVKDFVEPNIRKLLQMVPLRLKPRAKGSSLYFRNPAWHDPKALSEFHVFGCREEAESQRGFRSDLLILDEAAIIDRLRSIIENVLTQHFLGGRFLPLLLMGSTPPKSAGHDFTQKYIYQAKREGTYIKMPGSANLDYTENEDRIMLSVCKTRESPAYQREVECDETISDLESLAVPEWRKVKERCVVQDYPRPRFYFPFAGMDFGFNDWNACLFAWMDYERKRLIIEEEVVCRKVSTRELAEKLKTRESWLFGGELASPHPRAFHYRAMRRWGDNDLQELHDLRKEYKYYVTPAEKWDRAAALGNLCTKVQEERILVFEGCRNLIAQLDHGVLNEKRTDFERYPDSDDPDAPIMGHLDALAALMYLVRMCENYWFQNPIPDPRLGESQTLGPDQMLNPGHVPTEAERPASGVQITRKPILVSRRRL